jgi:capsular polysaccharide transport system permease protein
MVRKSFVLSSAAHFVSRNARIVGALMMREMITRFGREGIGFAWLIGEPLLFCFGVLIMWSIIKPEYEHGVRLGPFIMTGYMSLLLLRHQISYSMDALKGNIGLLHHRQVSVLHLYLSRNALEFGGATAAFVVVYVFLMLIGQVTLPHDYLILYGGWLTLGAMGGGLAIILSGLSMRFELMERLVPVLTYALIPISGAFFMVDWIPPQFREQYLLLPIPHGIEMVRAGVFGEFVPTHFNAAYALTWAGIMNVVGILLLANARNYIDVE